MSPTSKTEPIASVESVNELDIRGSQLNDQPEKYPLVIRAYGIISIVAAAIQIIAVVLVAILLIVNFAETGAIDFVDSAELRHFTIVTTVILVVDALVSFGLSIMFLILGIRLVRGNRLRAALLANVMITLESATLICQFMLTGFSMELIPIVVNMVILIALQSYSDPALRDERRLQHRLQQLEDKAQAEDGTLGRDLSGKGFITLNFFNLFWVFVICCVLGLVLEVIWHMVVVDPGVYQDRAGLLYGPFSPIYGLGAVFMTAALNCFHDKNFIIIFLISAVIGGAFEFSVSWFFETAFGITAWDYTGTFLSIDGRTNGMFMGMWGLLGLVWIKTLLPLLLNVINMIPWNWRYAVTTICAAFMFADCALSLAAFDCWFQRDSGTMNYENPSAITAFCNKEFDDDFMMNRFQSMTMHPEDASRAK